MVTGSTFLLLLYQEETWEGGGGSRREETKGLLLSQQLAGCYSSTAEFRQMAILEQSCVPHVSSSWSC